jgi:hypothetical protein
LLHYKSVAQTNGPAILCLRQKNPARFPPCQDNRF